MLKKYKENAKENSYWVNILGEYFWEGTDMNTGYTNTVNSITAKDLQEFTKALLEQNNRVEVSMTSETRHAAENEGKNPHLFLLEKTVEPSARTVAVSK